MIKQQLWWPGIAALTLIAACSQVTRDGTDKENVEPAPSPDVRLIDFVDPFIGTDGKGKTFPGATVPYGMVQLSPDNGRNGWDWISGYFYPDNVIGGFSHTHLSGTGAGDLYDISFMPISDSPVRLQLDDTNPQPTIVSHFSHDNERAEPGYYQVYLADYQVNVELSAALRTGVQRYEYQVPNGKIKLDLGYSRNWDKTVASEIEIVDQSTIRGYRKSTGWAPDQRTFFYTKFSQPFKTIAVTRDGEPISDAKVSGVNLVTILEFDTSENHKVTFATALSSVSTQNAQANLEHDIPLEKITDDTFKYVKSKAQNLWQEELSKVIVHADPDNKVQFYTALYHSALAPRLFSDVNGQYKGPDGKIHSVKHYPRYEFFSLWDTFRAQHPWKTITHPSRTREMMASIISHYEVYGLLPVWNFQGNETDMMMGYHAIPVLADAWLKGLLDISAPRLLAMMEKSANQSQFGIGVYNELGYVPYEEMTWNVSRTLEYAFDDYAIARVADAAGYTKLANAYYQRSRRYRQHFDPQTGMMRAKSRNGEFKLPFDAMAYHPEDYCEANAWQYSFFVPHDVEGLINLYPSRQAFVEKLQQMFTTQQDEGELPEWISGYIGQYVHGNEPAHHVAYLFRLAGQPHMGEKLLRKIMDELYSTKPDGLCGNEDAGQMSAWYLFSALGFYPVNPVGGEYVLGSPEVTRAVINLENGEVFQIHVENQSKENVYVSEVLLNGEKLLSDTLSHRDITAGGTLKFVMSQHPDESLN